MLRGSGRPWRGGGGGGEEGGRGEEWRRAVVGREEVGGQGVAGSGHGVATGGLGADRWKEGWSGEGGAEAGRTLRGSRRQDVG